MSPFSALSEESNGIRNCNWLSGFVPWSDEIISFCTGDRRQHIEITKLVGHHFCGDIVRRHLFRVLCTTASFQGLCRKAFFRGTCKSAPLRGHVYISKRCLSEKIWRKHFCFVFFFITFFRYDENKKKETNYFCVNVNSIFPELVVFVVPFGPDRVFFGKLL